MATIAPAATRRTARARRGERICLAALRRAEVAVASLLPRR